MHKIYIPALFLVALVALSTPNSTQAYGTSEQTAVRISDSHVLFTISYRFNFLNRGFTTPVLANTETVRTLNRVNIALMDNTGATSTASVYAIVLADEADIEDGVYSSSIGEGSDFTLIAIAELPRGEREHQLTVTSLPFTLIQASSSQPSQMPASELVKFTTPFVQ